MKSQSLLIILLLINNLPINAEVILDGTLGRSGALPGPDYLIGADLGYHQDKRQPVLDHFLWQLVPQKALKSHLP